MSDRTISKCQICGKMAEEEECIIDGKKDWSWGHIRPADHPPYPVTEYTKEEAKSDYAKFLKGDF
ncbi:MAG: hypothetical protein KGN01_07525 [Patescibacteria group bacterium]|nr:hypothetical protein [Patescibacteria group bacterium]